MNLLRNPFPTRPASQNAYKRQLVAVAVFCFAANTAFAAAPTLADIAKAETAQLALLCAVGALVIVVGTALYFGSLVRSKNTLSAMAQVLLGATAATVTWVMWAGDLALSTPSTGWLAPILPGLNQDLASVTRQIGMFPLITLAGCLLFGGVVERIRLESVLVFSVFFTLLIAAPVLRAVQGSGLLGALGYADWVGAGCLHIAVGISALGLSLATGTRRGYGRIPLPPYHLGLGFVGALVMVLGWILGLISGDHVSAPFATEILAPNLFAGMMGGVLSWMALERLRSHLVSTLGMASGAIAGTVACSTNAMWLNPRLAIVVGVLGAAAGFLGAVFIRRLRNVDDSMDIFSLHALPAAVGLLVLPLFGPDSIAFGPQLAGVLITAAYVAALTAVIAMPLKFFNLLRVSFDDEDAGLDLTLHSETVHPPQSTL